MKIYFYIIFVLFYSFDILIADEIYLKNSEIIKGEILQVTDKNVEYREYNGKPFLVIPLDQVLKIEYDKKKESVGLAETKSLIETFDDYSSIRTALRFTGFSFIIKDADAKGKDIYYATNAPASICVSISYKQFGFSASKELDYDNNTDELGKTTYTDFQLYYYSRKFACELFYQKYQGYFLEHPGDFNYKKGDSNAVRSDIKTYHQGFNFYYIFSDNFSLDASMNQSERQNKFSWSFMLMASAHRLKINSSYNLIPPNQSSFYGDESTYTGGDYTAISVSPGIGVTLPFRNYFISLVYFMGYGISISENHYAEDQQKKNIQNILKYNGKISIGYNGDNIIYGLAWSTDIINIILYKNKLNLTTMASYIECFFGVRF